jgi:hypothetical protein
MYETTEKSAPLPNIDVLFTWTPAACAARGIQELDTTVIVPLGDVLTPAEIAGRIADGTLHQIPAVARAEAPLDGTEDAATVAARAVSACRAALAAEDAQRAARRSADAERAARHADDDAAQRAANAAEEAIRATVIGHATDAQWRKIVNHWDRGTEADDWGLGAAIEVFGFNHQKGVVADVDAAWKQWIATGHAIWASQVACLLEAHPDQAVRDRHAAGRTPQADADAAVKVWCFDALEEVLANLDTPVVGYTLADGEHVSVAPDGLSIPHWQVLADVQATVASGVDTRSLPYCVQYAVEAVTVDGLNGIVSAVRVTAYFGHRRYRRIYAA